MVSVYKKFLSLDVITFAICIIVFNRKLESLDEFLSIEGIYFLGFVIQ